MQAFYKNRVEINTVIARDIIYLTLTKIVEIIIFYLLSYMHSIRYKIFIFTTVIARDLTR